MSNIIYRSSGVDEFDSTTTMVFYQTSAPTGWVQDTNHNDKALRVVNGAGGGNAGTHDLSSPPNASHSHTVNAHDHSTPDHVHIISTHLTQLSGGPGADQNKAAYGVNTGSPAGTAEGAGTTSGASNSGTSDVSPTAFAPKYIDIIVCIKD